ncbi:MAG: FABP family protein [Gammaproteobacteria bacterium]|nr:FABP family protein [Gammaproteobacteria bacterium]
MNESTTIEGIAYGPLASLPGIWKGDKGMDIAPEPDGQEENPFYETITFEAIGDVTNAEKQHLAALRYHQVVSRKSNHEVFHNETGYWMWDAEQGVIMQALTIPRGISLLAGGTFRESVQGEQIVLEVRASIDDADWGIVQSPFMRDNAKTLKFDHKITIQGDTLVYDETTVLDIFGSRFDHTDENTLVRNMASN